MTPDLFNHSLRSIDSYHDAWRDAGDISEWAWSRRSTAKVLLRRTIQQPLHTRISNALFSLPTSLHHLLFFGEEFGFSIGLSLPSSVYIPRLSDSG
ncbi:conserved hypothetical protein [Aspergillus lentulus]|nr:conserved hypothetical protein [Aspergillus lentulus]